MIQKTADELIQTCLRKKPFRNRREARAAMNGVIATEPDDRKGLCVYRCQICLQFHVGHKRGTWYKHKRNKEL